MSLSTRELYLALRVRDEGTRNMQRFAQELVRTGTAARVASIKAQADSVREQADLKRNELALARSTVARLRDQDASRAQIRGAQARVATLQQETVELERQAQGFDRQATAIMRHSQQLSHFTNTMTQTSVALETVGVGIAFAGVAVLSAMHNFIDTAVEYQRQVALTRTQVDGFGASLQGISEMGLRVARNVAVPFDQIQTALYDIFSTTNANMAQGEVLLTAFAKQAVAGQVGVQDAARLTMGIMNAFNIPLDDVNRVLDIQFELVRKGAGTYAEFSSTLGRAISSTTRAGQSFETLAGMVAYLTRTQAISTSMAATSAARALDALSNPAAITAMEDLGVRATTAEGNLRPLVEILGDLRTHLNQLDEPGRVAKTKEILDIFKGAAGTIQARRFLEQVLLGPDDLAQLKSSVESMGKTSCEF